MTDNEQRSSAEVAFAKAEAVYRRGFGLRGLTLRKNLVSGVTRLSVGEDCEDGMAEFRRLESAKMRGEEAG